MNEKLSLVLQPQRASIKGKEKKMTLAEIYKYIQDNFPYYRSAGSGWKVSDFSVVVVF
jgi:hypothetical protein